MDRAVQLVGIHNGLTWRPAMWDSRRCAEALTFPTAPECQRVRYDAACFPDHSFQGVLQDMKIESEDIDVESLLTGRSFRIPRFQRPYSWDDENIQDLWEDVTANAGEDYFIGSMVVYRHAKQVFGVVDGQQRLTTLTILLCAIRDAFAQLGENDLALGIHQLIERNNRENVSEVVLKTETSYPYFQEYIQKFGDPSFEVEELAEESNLRRAHALLTQRVNSILESVDIDESVKSGAKSKTKAERLKALRDTVFNLKLIFVTLENEDDAYLIFETLNTRGKDLAVTDLAKNLFTKHLRRDTAVDGVTERWTRILETIHNSDVDITSDSFIYHFWASREDYVPLKKIYPAMKKKINQQNADSYLDDLVADSKLYRSIFEPTYEWSVNESEIAASLSAMQIFRLVQPIPGVLSLVRAYRTGIIKNRKLLEALTAIEHFHFAFTAVTSSRSSGGISGMYSAFGRRLYAAEWN